MCYLFWVLGTRDLKVTDCALSRAFSLQLIPELHCIALTFTNDYCLFCLLNKVASDTNSINFILAEIETSLPARPSGIVSVG